MKIILSVVACSIFFSVAPIFLAAKYLQERDEILNQGEVVVEFWEPSDARVFLDRTEWEKEFPPDKDDYGTIFSSTFSDYKKNFEGEKHFILVEFRHIKYETRQGKVVVWVIAEGSRSGFVKDTLGKPIYIGKGKVSFPVTESENGQRQCIFVALFMGLVVDTALVIVGCAVVFFGFAVYQNFIEPFIKR